MKAVIMDLDRTLLRTDKTVSKYTLDVMRKCHENGIAVMTATARPERTIQAYHHQIRFDAITIMNGARIILPKAVLKNGISHLSAKHILSRLVAIPDAVLFVETGSGLYSNSEDSEWTPTYYTGFPDLPTQDVLYKILVRGGGNTLYHQVQSALTEDVYCTLAENELIQIMSKSATKWNGIRAMLKALNRSEAEAVYFGDDNDDLESIRMCGTGVAVANAIEAVMKEADFVTGTNDEDGVARFIEENLL